jgi:phospholipid/cholesterol/gamma-HCH transport system substrate-binding protein
MEMLGTFDIFKRGIRIHALFNTVQELKEGDPVKMAGVQIGRVEKIDLKESKVDVTMKVERSASVKTDSKAMVKFAGLMGQNFVSISFGSPAALKVENDFIIQTEEQPDLNALMTKLESVASGVENLTKSFSGDSIQNLLGPFSDFIKENNPRLTAFFSNMKTISAQIAEGRGTMGKLINEDTLYASALAAVTNFNATASDIRAAVAQASNVVSQVNQGKGTFGKLARDEALYTEATAAMTNLKEIFQKINQGQGSAGKLVNDESFYRNAKLSLQKLDKATEGLEDQGPLSVLGIAINSLF